MLRGYILAKPSSARSESIVAMSQLLPTLLPQDVTDQRSTDWHCSEEERASETTVQAHSDARYGEERSARLPVADRLARATVENAELQQQRCAERGAGQAQGHMSGRTKSAFATTEPSKHPEGRQAHDPVACRDKAVSEVQVLQQRLSSVEAALKASVQRATTFQAQLQVLSRTSLCHDAATPSCNA